MTKKWIWETSMSPVYAPITEREAKRMVEEKELGTLREVELTEVQARRLDKAQSDFLAILLEVEAKFYADLL